MMVRYILKSFVRHKGRTAIIVLALLIVTVMLMILNNAVESLQQQDVKFVESEAGAHDIAITRAETSPDQLIDIERISTLLRDTAPTVAVICPRFQATVELQGVGHAASASLIARTPTDDLGQVTMQEGIHNLEGDRVVINRAMADTFGLAVGDQIGLSYLLPASRLPGYDLPQNGSVGRATRNFTISGLAQARGLGGGGRFLILASVDTVQNWLNVPGEAERLVVVLDKTIYTSMNTQASVFRVRRVAEEMRDALSATLGNDQAIHYEFSIAKAQALVDSGEAFAFQRALTNVYSFLVMGVVGLLVYSIINTNVEERQRDMAFLRVLGGKRSHLFGLVLVEVALIGLIGVGLGIAIGQALGLWVLIPVVNYFITQSGSSAKFEMMITLAAMGRTALTAAIVLAVSTIAPAYKAARTKIRHAINPGNADSLQIEDLARLRSRKFDTGFLIVGLLLTGLWVPMFVSLQALIGGNVSVITFLMFGGLVVIVTGASLLFFALTVPFERVLISLSKVIFPKLTFFAGPNLMRAKRRNTMIALMIVLSATLPTFLGTMVVLEQANNDSQTRLQTGAPITTELGPRQPASFLDEFRALPGVAQTSGVTGGYQVQMTNQVALRSTYVRVYGITHSLDGIVYPDLIRYGDGGPRAFAEMLAEPDTIILSVEYAEYMDLSVGDVVRVPGKGKDHVVNMRVVGLVESLPGFQGLYARGAARMENSEAVVSLDTYIRLTNDPAVSNVCPTGACLAAEREQPVIGRVLATTADGADEAVVAADLRRYFASKNGVEVTSTAEVVREVVQYMKTAHLLMLAMAALSFVTSVLGVFAVVYVAVYARRREIGMLKAVGMSRRALVGTFALEAVMLTVSATLAGAVAGTVLGYFFYLTFNLMRLLPTPQYLTFDWLTTLAILVVVILASLVSAALAARGVVRSKVTEILRGA
ncbi:MAG: FtsX-like permease family protein [Chloroflexi bacterium]|nr:FtsX-like permease family protein [Chloroflexota bacterium]